jgi:CRP/FNR family transcriptional regulator, cyclic AMP receptor protein
MTWHSIFGHGKDSEPRLSRRADLLARVPIFDNLTKRELGILDRILHRREYLQDEVIFRQGEPGMGMYVVQRGTVAIMSESENQQLFEMQEGDFFGEIALLDDAPRSATAVARTNCTVAGLFKPDLFDLIDRDPRLGVKIVVRLARHLSGRLRQADDWVLALSTELEALKHADEHEHHS